MISTDMKYHLHVQKLHSHYGDFVRTGPRELTVLRASAVDLIYGPSSKCTKGTWYNQNSGDADKCGIENVRDKEKHRIRRKAWDMGLGFRALELYENRVADKVKQLMKRIGSGKPVNVTQDNIFFAWDVMGEISFSKDFKMLHTGIEHPAVDGLHWAMATAGVVTTLPWLMNMLRVIPGATGKFEHFARWCSEELDMKRKALALEKASGESKESQDVMSFIIKAQQEGERSAPPTESAIREDVRTLVSAGSDTVAIAFTNFLYFMVKYPKIYKKLQNLVSAEFPSGPSTWNYKRARKISYIDKLIHETLRLRPPVPMGFPRQTPPEGLQIDEVFIPGDVIVNVPTWSLQHDERYFESATEFVPERWEGDLSSEKAAYLPFQRGPFTCVGKSMAMMQMRMLISSVALSYDVAFAPGEDGLEFWDGAKETLTLWIPGLEMVFTPRS
ncbi:cytochrome P450 [Penicillium taxi]|uniref:cytochrome P450 n=1 Tax=Penicillium taxi TaxID=168475 RepID=UPI002545A31C|nr:cytochrome P450 [Penicillium taxi]KAJ5895288.1 cytochrome P450 [Penicillium taxi]